MNPYPKSLVWIQTRTDGGDGIGQASQETALVKPPLSGKWRVSGIGQAHNDALAVAHSGERAALVKPSPRLTLVSHIDLGRPDWHGYHTRTPSAQSSGYISTLKTGSEGGWGL